MALRIDLELFAVRKALLKGVDLAGALQHSMERLRKATRDLDYDLFRSADYDLHAALVGLADFPLLDKFWHELWEELRQFHDDSLEVLWPELRVLMAEHEYLVRAIIARDLAAAEDGIRHHLEAVWFRMAESRGELQDDAEPLQRATSYLAFSYHREVRLDHLARKVAFCSEGHLSKLFRLRYGVSFQTFLVNMRLDKASELLRQTRLPVGKIARRVGYNDIPRFGQHFKRRFGTAPARSRPKTSD